MKKEKCPVCGSTIINHQEGCIICLSCGWSSCNNFIKKLLKK